MQPWRCFLNRIHDHSPPYGEHINYHALQCWGFTVVLSCFYCKRAFFILGVMSAMMKNIQLLLNLYWWKLKLVFSSAIIPAIIPNYSINIEGGWIAELLFKMILATIYNSTSFHVERGRYRSAQSQLYFQERKIMLGDGNILIDFNVHNFSLWKIIMPFLPMVQYDVACKFLFFVIIIVFWTNKIKPDR